MEADVIQMPGAKPAAKTKVVTVSDEVHSMLKIFAAMRGLKIAEVVEAAVKSHLQTPLEVVPRD